MDYKKNFFILLGAILLYGFYSFVETQKQENLLISKPAQQEIMESKEIANETAMVPFEKPVVKAVTRTIVKPVVKQIIQSPPKIATRRIHRRELAEFKKEFSRIYYSDDKIVEYKMKMQKQQQLDERNLQSEFDNLFTGKN